MTRAQVILTTLVLYKIVLVLIGLWAQRRTKDTTDFFLGGRRLGALVAAISASASSSSAWTLLGVSGAAFSLGLPSLWLFPATVSGFLVNWLWVAPRLMPAGRAAGSVTLPEFIAGDGAHAMLILRVCSVVVVFSFFFYIAAQFEAAGTAFSSNFDLPKDASIAIGAAVVLVYTLLGGFWAVSVTDTLQGLLMALTAVVLPVAAFVAVGGYGGLIAGLAAAPDLDALSPTGVHTGIAAVGFVLGTLGIGLGYPGQPHVVNRFMALRDERALQQAKVIAIAWALVVYAGMLLLGLCARVLVTTTAAESEAVFFTMTNELFPPVMAGIMVAAVLSAIMSTADSQLLVAASSATYDWRRADTRSQMRLVQTRIAVALLSLAAMLLAILATDTIFNRVLFAWHAVGSAFGPVLLLRLAAQKMHSGFVLAAIVTGFSATVVLHWMPQTPGDFAERLLPFAMSLAIAWMGRVRGVSVQDRARD